MIFLINPFNRTVLLTLLTFGTFSVSSIKVGDKAEDGSQLRPYIVMFGEYVDGMDLAIDVISKADIFVVIGTSLKVYPAAGFVNYAHHEVPKFIIDPGNMEQCEELGFTHFKTTATEGMKMLLKAFKDL